MNTNRVSTNLTDYNNITLTSVSCPCLNIPTSNNHCQVPVCLTCILLMCILLKWVSSWQILQISKVQYSVSKTLLVHRKYKKTSLYPLSILNLKPPPMDSISHVIFICANINLSNTMIRTLLVIMKKCFPFVTQFNTRPNIKEF